MSLELVLAANRAKKAGDTWQWVDALFWFCIQQTGDVGVIFRFPTTDESM